MQEISAECITVGMCSKGVCNGGQFMQKRSEESMTVPSMCSVHVFDSIAVLTICRSEMQSF